MAQHALRQVVSRAACEECTHFSEPAVDCRGCAVSVCVEAVHSTGRWGAGAVGGGVCWVWNCGAVRDRGGGDEVLAVRGGDTGIGFTAAEPALMRIPSAVGLIYLWLAPPTPPSHLGTCLGTCDMLHAALAALHAPYTRGLLPIARGAGLQHIPESVNAVGACVCVCVGGGGGGLQCLQDCPLMAMLHLCTMLGACSCSNAPS